MVKQGYKQTEIGTIPEDWKCVRFGECVKIYRGGSPRPIQHYITTSSDGINWIKIGDVRENDKYITSTQEKIISEGISKSREVHIGDFILSNSMSFGRPYILNINGCIHDGWLTIQEYKNIFTTEYLYYLLSSNIVYQQYISMAAGSSVKNLNKDKVSSLMVMYPLKPEQESISSALSDVDGMISSLEKLIAKKKAVKQGAMQELLTGNKRLSGYTGNWKKYKLDDLLKYEQPTNYIVHNTEYVEQGVPVLTAGKSLLLGYTNESDGIYENLPVIIFDDFVTSSKYITYKFKVKSSAMKMLTLKNDKMSLRLIFELMQMIDFKPYDHQRHWISQYSQFEIYLPEEVEEQNAIASILSDMDNEIEALEQKLAKTRQLKQGMMQQLLTGRIRLIDQEKVSAVTTKQKASAEMKTGHNHQFDDAVMIAAIVNAFYSEKYPLGRKKVQKLLYLLRRKQEVDTSEFKKKAAGPYADEVRYKGGEPIAKRNSYIATSTTSKGTSFSKGKKIDTALNYVKKWGMEADFDWLLSQFKYTSVNDLELYATIDMAICDLQNEGIEISVDTVKNLIGSNKEWKAKLKKNYFSDADIARAIAMSKKLFS